ncbi:hypothetical protein T492DRAFT_208110 [Pavlovales sp. CCMP2436]|nr:hypothetical protein T492DRAFT_208110 [Pavlovales sp. CCMP2436]
MRCCSTSLACCTTGRHRMRARRRLCASSSAWRASASSSSPTRRSGGSRPLIGCTLVEAMGRRHNTPPPQALGFGMCTWLESASVAGVPLITVVTSGDIVWNELREKMRAPASGFQPGLSADAISIPAGAVSGTKAVIADIIAAAELAAEAGEFARESEIQIAADAIFELAGSWCVVYGNGDDDDEYVGTAGCTAAAVEQADFILARGMFELRTGRGEGGAQPFDSELHGEALLRRALERGLPMIVANPDMVRPDGKDSPMPGVLAAQYAQMGGDVRYVGKPHTRVYQVIYFIIIIIIILFLILIVVVVVILVLVLVLVLLVVACFVLFAKTMCPCCISTAMTERVEFVCAH